MGIGKMKKRKKALNRQKYMRQSIRETKHVGKLLYYKFREMSAQKVTQQWNTAAAHNLKTIQIQSLGQSRSKGHLRRQIINTRITERCTTRCTAPVPLNQSPSTLPKSLNRFSVQTISVSSICYTVFAQWRAQLTEFKKSYAVQNKLTIGYFFFKSRWIIRAYCRADASFPCLQTDNAANYGTGNWLNCQCRNSHYARTTNSDSLS